MTIRELCEEAHSNAVAHGFHEYPEPPMDRVPLWIALAHSELSEALEAWRGYDVVATFVCEEFADLVIRIADTCETLGVDLEELIVKKVAANRLRPYKHGKRA